MIRFTLRAFSALGEVSLTTALSCRDGECIGGPYGVCHGDEGYLQFSPLKMWYILGDTELNTADEEVANALLGLWKNFIKTGTASTKGKLISFYQLIVETNKGLNTV